MLGGSFNPAHEGHLQISLEALRRLGLDEVWWLVSPQNPLKKVKGMAPMAERLAGARLMARHPRLRVTDIEARLGTRYTADTLRALKRRFPHHDFVWLMGADNLSQIPAWRSWSYIFHTVPVAIFARPTYSLGALAGKAARRFNRVRRPERAARDIPGQAPAWVFFHTRLMPISATALRAQKAAGRRKSGGPRAQSQSMATARRRS
ncbi:MAG: nicotinate-nucleotide adenylyltransferase [Candidatus Eiseniibacteriota bacterium]